MGGKEKEWRVSAQGEGKRKVYKKHSFWYGTHCKNGKSNITVHIMQPNTPFSQYFTLLSFHTHASHVTYSTRSFKHKHSLLSMHLCATTAIVVLKIRQHHSVLCAVLRDQSVVQRGVVQLAVRRLGGTLLA